MNSFSFFRCVTLKTIYLCWWRVLELVSSRVIGFNQKVRILLYFNMTYFGFETICFRVGACSQSCSAEESWLSVLVALSLSGPWAPSSFPSLEVVLIDTRMIEHSWAPVPSILLLSPSVRDNLLSSSSKRRLKTPDIASYLLCWTWRAILDLSMLMSCDVFSKT